MVGFCRIVIESFQLPLFVVIEYFQSAQKGSMPYAFKKPLMRAFQKHMACLCFWSPLDGEGVSDVDRTFSVTIEHPCHQMSIKILQLPKKAWSGDDFFSKMILHAPPVFGNGKISVTIQHTPTIKWRSKFFDHQKGQGLCYHFAKNQKSSPTFLLGQLKKFGCHPMVWVCQMATEILQLPSNTPPLFNTG